VNEVEGCAHQKYPFFDSSAVDGAAPAWFELMTLYFFLCARLAACDVLAIETGMGGRLDATNIVDPLVSIISIIELEHTEYLGNNLVSIAGEKAGIIKHARPLILAEQEQEVLAVFKARAGEKQAPLFYFPGEARISKCRLHCDGTDFSLELKNTNGFSDPLRLSVPVPGAIQAQNAGLAALALKSAFPSMKPDILVRGLASIKLPARFERISGDPVLIIDGAHTPRSMEETVKTFTELYGEGNVLLFGCADGKNAEAMAELLIPHFSAVIITAPGLFKASHPMDLYRIFTQEAALRESPVSIRLVEETGAAIDEAVKLGKESGRAVLGAGSFYLAAEIRKQNNG
jgi:dihydrofolate synthase/folylpolyglutamate synthase